MKNLDDLPNDIYQLFNPTENHEVNEENLDALCEDLKDILKRKLSKQERGSALRFSALGKGDRQIWYSAHPDKVKSEETMLLKNYFKFLYGDVIELLVLFLAKEAGHKVESEQAEVEVDGVKGHIDAVIDGTVIDVKSASPYSFKKFKDGGLFDNDPFGYIKQISGYSSVLTPDKEAAFLAVNKVDGDITVSKVSASVIKDNLPEPRIEHLKEIVASEEPPPRCYDDEPDGKSGNRKLGVNCSYCAFKKDCWPEVRTFLYSSGPRFLTKVEREPDVFEVIDD